MSKKEEEKVYKQLLTVKDDTFLTIDREVHTSFSCITAGTGKKFARLDFVIELPTHRVVLEVDERQHKDTSYNVLCDVSRMLDVMSMMCMRNDRKTRWIRFNPNAFEKDRVVQRVSPGRRYEALLQTIQRSPSMNNDMELVYMYYDVDKNDDLLLFRDPDYHAQVKSLVTQVVIR